MPCSAWAARRLPSKENGRVDDADGQRAERPCDAGHDRRTAGARAAALAGGDEHHVRTLESVLDVLRMVLGRLAALVRVRAGSKSARQITADVELDVRVAHQQRLRVSVDRDEFDTPKPGFDHPVDCVDATAADANDLDDRQIVL